MTEELELIGKRTADLGGEAGLLESVLALAERQAANGGGPFAALVVRDGEVVGVGVNTIEQDFDPSAHAEVTAIRDAAAHVRNSRLPGTILYTSCEPCALCRTVAHAAGVGELVYAAAKELIPPEMGVPDEVIELIDAVAAVLPGQTRISNASIPEERRVRPFTVFVEHSDG